MADDGLEEHERRGRMERRTGPTVWTGLAEGGPIDGGAVTVEAVPSLAMRGLHVSVCVGEDVEAAEWHLYAFGQPPDRPPNGTSSTWAD